MKLPHGKPAGSGRRNLATAKAFDWKPVLHLCGDVVVCGWSFIARQGGVKGE